MMPDQPAELGVPLEPLSREGRGRAPLPARFNRHIDTTREREASQTTASTPAGEDATVSENSTPSTTTADRALGSSGRSGPESDDASEATTSALAACRPSAKTLRKDAMWGIGIFAASYAGYSGYKALRNHNWQVRNEFREGCEDDLVR